MPINISKLPYVSICSRLIAISLYRYCALYWPIVILVNPLYFLFSWSESVIVLYIALYIALFDFVIALYIALRGTRI